MELAMGAMAPLVPKLLQLLSDEYVKQKGLKPEVESLSRELAMMHAALVHLSQVPTEQVSEQDKEWARQVRELSYDMEDAVDAFMIRVAARQLSGPGDANIFKKIAGKVKKLKDSRQISNKIKKIKKIIKERGEQRARYMFSDGALPMNNDSCEISDQIKDIIKNIGVDPLVLNLYKNEEQLVGMEEAADELIRKVTHQDGSQSLKIISIVGPAGLGKTTLAKVVFDRLKERSFDCSAFFSVGRNPNITNTLRDMFKKLGGTYSEGVDLASWSVEQLREKLHQVLHGKRYIIVADDVWEETTWDIINCALLRDSNSRSRVIITTQSHDVSSQANDVYKLNPLPRDKSKELFCKRTFGRNEAYLYNQLAEISNKIIDKCDGVPSAIIAIASLLADRSFEDWPKVYDSFIGYELSNTRMVLLKSYYVLPSFLKPCLLYLSMYPEGRLIKKSTLIWRWIAEGFVQIQREGDSFFKVGERYYNELLNRSVIQEVEDNGDGIADCCRVHNIALDLFRGLSKEENFATILGEKHGELDGFMRKVLRLSMRRCRTEHIPRDTMAMPEVVRSLSIISSEIEGMPLLSSFQACRVLVIEESSTGDLKHLDKLLNLRYLEINGSKSDYKLPKEIGNLRFLQTLILINTGIEEPALPPAVCELRQLMCLHVIGYKTMPADRMGNLGCLEELKLNVREVDDFMVELGKLVKLRMLEIEFFRDLNETSYNALMRSLCNLTEIRELNLWSKMQMHMDIIAWEGWEPPRSLWRLNIGHMGSSPPMNPSRFQDLCYLSLFKEMVEAKDLENLALLPQLLYLHLRGYSVQQGITVSANGFEKLRVCRVPTTFKFLEGAMRRLESLHLTIVLEYYEYPTFRRRERLMVTQLPTRDTVPNLDFGLQNLGSLKEVIVTVDCSHSFLRDIEAAEDLVKKAVRNEHPNRPKLEMRRVGERYMLSDDELKPDKVQNLPLSARDTKGIDFTTLNPCGAILGLRKSLLTSTVRVPSYLRWRKLKRLYGTQLACIATVQVCT
ncbi:hypothetical protein ACP4OV_001955 [Aristida adscensionis]